LWLWNLKQQILAIAHRNGINTTNLIFEFPCPLFSFQKWVGHLTVAGVAKFTINLHWSLQGSCFAPFTMQHNNSVLMEAKYFASCCPLSVFKRVVLLHFRQHNNSIYCGNGSEIFCFLLPIGFMEARTGAKLAPFN
jgi:hypothetical protein